MVAIPSLASYAIFHKMFEVDTSQGDWIAIELLPKLEHSVLGPFKIDFFKKLNVVNYFWHVNRLTFLSVFA